MAGTRITGPQVIEVVDGDTIKVEADDAMRELTGKEQQESLRLACVDTEESRNRGGKPMTQAGKDAKEMARRYFGAGGGGLTRVDLEFDANETKDDTTAPGPGGTGRPTDRRGAAGRVDPDDRIAGRARRCGQCSATGSRRPGWARWPPRSWRRG